MEAWKLAFLIGLGAQVPMAMGQVKAFDEAEGFGQFATGARQNLSSASIYHVTNLNDSGAGSFRDAVSQSNRFVVFDVGGIINLNSNMVVSSNVTIAGQTAPGGISTFGAKVSYSGANNALTRYMAYRLGRAQGREDASGASNGANMMFDHMSITWGVDETFSFNSDGKGTLLNNITVQDSIVGQGLDVVGHSAAGLMTFPENSRFSLIRNLFTDSGTRNPKVRGENEFINNVVYGWTTAGYIMGDTVNMDSHANVINNYMMEGGVNGGSAFASGTPNFHIYASGNYLDQNRDGVMNGSLITSYPGADVLSAPVDWSGHTETVATMTAVQAYAYVMAHAGPSIVRDAVDTRLAAELASYGTLGGMILRETDLFPGWGTDAKYLNPRARLVDTDNDGMPDNWETAKGLNPNSNSTSEWRALMPDGRTRLEQYLNELGANGETIMSAGGDWSNSATWSGAAPTLADSAIVVGNLTVSSGNAFARRLAVGGNLSITGGTLDVFDTAQVDGTLSLSGGTATLGRILLSSANTNASLTLGPGSTVQTGPIANGGGTALLTFNGGTFKALGGPDISVATVIAAGGGTINTNGYSGTISGGLSGTGALTKTGAGTLTLAGNNSGFGGAINLNSGALTLATSSGNSSTGAINAANGTTVNVTTSGASTPLALNSGATVALVPGGGLTYGGNITGGSNTTLNVTSTSTGNSNFSIGGLLTGFAGTLNLGSSTGNVRINQGGSALANFNAGTSTGTLRVSNDGVTHFGSLAGGSGTFLTGSTNDAVATTFSIGANGNSTTFAGTIGNGTNATPSVVNVTKVGAGTLTLSGPNTFTGNVSVDNGTLVAARGNNTVNPTSSALGNPQTAGRSVVVGNGGTLRFDAGDTFGGATSAVSTSIVINAGGTVTNGGSYFTRLGSVTLNGGTLTAVGRANANYQTYSFDANAVVTAGGSAPSTIASGSSSNGIHLHANTLFNVADATGNSAVDLTVSAPLINRNGSEGGLASAAGLTKSGLGTMALTGTNAYTGVTAVNGGTLIVNGTNGGAGAVTVANNARLGGSGSIAGAVTVNNGGTLAPGNSAGVIDLLGGLTLASGSNLAIELSGAAVGSGYDQANVTGSVSLGGANLLATLGFAPTAGGNFFIVRNDGVDAIAGQFAGLADGAQFSLASSDGQSYGFQISYFGDADLGLTVGGNDVVLTSLGVVPEPASLASIAAALAIGLGRRRRRVA